MTSCTSPAVTRQRALAASASRSSQDARRRRGSGCSRSCRSAELRAAGAQARADRRASCARHERRRRSRRARSWRWAIEARVASARRALARRDRRRRRGLPAGAAARRAHRGQEAALRASSWRRSSRGREASAGPAAAEAQQELLGRMHDLQMLIDRVRAACRRRSTPPDVGALARARRARSSRSKTTAGGCTPATCATAARCIALCERLQRTAPRARGRTSQATPGRAERDARTLRALSDSPRPRRGARRGVARRRKRPLTEEGMSRMRKAARGLARLGVAFDVVLTSPLVRARQTAEIVAAASTPRPPLVNVDSLAPGGTLRGGGRRSREARAQDAHRARRPRAGHRRAGRAAHRLAPSDRVQEGRGLPHRRRRRCRRPAPGDSALVPDAEDPPRAHARSSLAESSGPAS